MKIILHEPATEEGKAELADLAAIFHARVVTDCVLSLPCSWEEKLALISRMTKETHSL